MGSRREETLMRLPSRRASSSWGSAETEPVGGAVEIAAAQDPELPRATPAIQIEGLSKEFVRRDGAVVKAIDDVSLTIERGEFVVLLGPSGCGKTTTLRCIAGLEKPDRGSIHICGETVVSGDGRTNMPPHQRSLNMVFQSYALWPHMTVMQNVAFPLRSGGMSRQAAQTRVDEVLSLIGISELGRQHPGQLSGGQQQRVALARALANGDQLILFDEPLSNVDAKVREHLRFELLEMQRALGFSAVYVTHDQQEAMELADRVIVFDHGRIAQDAPPAEIYNRPSSLHVANFIGSANELSGVVKAVSEELVEVETVLGPVHAQRTGSFVPGDQVVVLWRPETGEIVSASDELVSGPDAVWEGIVQSAMFAGATTQVLVALGELRFRFVHMGGAIPETGSTVKVRIPSAHSLVFALPQTPEVAAT